MKKKFLALSFCCASLLGFAQTDTLAPMVISSSGNDVTVGGVELSYTVGEAVITTLQFPAAGPAAMYLTQGFHQPTNNNALNFIFTKSDETCLGSNDGSAILLISGGTAPYTIVWSSNPVFNNVSIDSLKPGTYTVSVTDAHGLNKNTTFTVVGSTAECMVKFYNGITPNGDGHNDTWVIDNIELWPDNSVAIYNRWGSEVWHANGYNNTTVVWKGDNQQGQPLPDATYFYLVTVNGTTHKGWVQLTR
jgi:gliding motility-associated-like protein